MVDATLVLGGWSVRRFLTVRLMHERELQLVEESGGSTSTGAKTATFYQWKHKNYYLVAIYASVMHGIYFLYLVYDTLLEHK